MRREWDHPVKTFPPLKRKIINVVYHWRGSDELGPKAAAVHLGLLPGSTAIALPGKLNLPFSGGFPRKNLGVLVFMGRAKNGENIYILPRGDKPEIVLTVIRKTAELFKINSERYLFIDCEERMRLAGGGEHSDESTLLRKMVAEVKKGLRG